MNYHLQLSVYFVYSDLNPFVTNLNAREQLFIGNMFGNLDLRY